MYAVLALTNSSESPKASFFSSIELFNPDELLNGAGNASVLRAVRLTFNFLKGDVEILGIAATKKQTEPIIYPNPTNGTLLTIQKRNRQAYTFILVDLTGKVMISETSNAGTELHQFDVNKVSDGLYILQSEGADNSKYFTRVLVVKQK